MALFDPIGRKDYVTSNSILKATRRKFKTISIVFSFVPFIVSPLVLPEKSRNEFFLFVYFMIRIQLRSA